MRHAVAVISVACALTLMLGGLSEAKPDRMALHASSDKRIVTVSVYLPDVTDGYRWLVVSGCSAEVTEDGTFCTPNFSRRSEMEPQRRKQHLVFWRDLPGGTMQVSAVALDASGNVLARAQATIFRSAW